MDFAVPADNRGEIKESVTLNRYLKHYRELKFLWNMKMMVLPIVVDSHETVPNGIVKRLREIRNQKKELRLSVLLKYARILLSLRPQ